MINLNFGKRDARYSEVIGMKTLFMVMLILASALFIAGCTQNATPGQSAPQGNQTPSTIGVASSSLGTILVDANGMTLYYFAADIPASGISSCSGPCIGIWPVFSPGTVTVSAPLAASDFSSFVRDDGKTQVTYRGWPLYYFAKDATPGDVNGENVLGTWFVVKPDETVMIAQQSALGSFLTDSRGNTLYYFAKDTPGTSMCTGGCTGKWPSFDTATISAPSVLSPAAFSSMMRADGMNQTTYMGRPLYYFANDTKPGDTNGEGFNNLWYVAAINGTIPVSSAPLPASTMMPETAMPTVTATPSMAMLVTSGGY